MSLQRQLEYETPPEEQAKEPDDPDETPTSEGTGGDDVDPWPFLKQGSVLGTAAFAVSYLVAYQQYLAFRGGFETPEGGPPAWVIAGWTVLTSHGGTFGGEQTAIRQVVSNQLGAVFLIPILVLTLVGAGYLLGRALEPTSPRSIGLCAASIVPSYLVWVVATSQVATFTPDGVDESGGVGSSRWAELEGEAIAIDVDGTLLVTTALLVFAFACIGVGFERWTTLFGNDSEHPGETSTRSGETGDATDGAVSSSDTVDSPNGSRSDVKSGVNATREPPGEQSRADGSETDASTADHDRYRPDADHSRSDGSDSESSTGTHADSIASTDDHERYRPSRE